jgi:hypothetical protein
MASAEALPRIVSVAGHAIVLRDLQSFIRQPTIAVDEGMKLDHGLRFARR